MVVFLQNYSEDKRMAEKCLYGVEVEDGLTQEEAECVKVKVS